MYLTSALSRTLPLPLPLPLSIFLFSVLKCVPWPFLLSRRVLNVFSFFYLLSSYPVVTSDIVAAFPFVTRNN